MIHRGKPWLLFSVLLSLFGVTSPYKVGLNLHLDHWAQTTSAVKRVTEFTLSTLDNTTEIELITKGYTSSLYTSLYDSICALLEENVTAIISASNSATTGGYIYIVHVIM